MSCDCIKNLNQLFKERLNETAEVDAGLIIPDDGVRVRLQAYYHEKRKGGIYVRELESQPITAEYCPFCGKKYKEDEK